MIRVAVYSVLLCAGLFLSQVVPPALGQALPAYELAVKPLTMAALAFIMIHVGYEFEIDKSAWRSNVWDYVVAMTAATFPWILVAAYYIFALAPPELRWSEQLWKDSLLQARFASPTSAGVLFSMLAAAGLTATWVFRKARILAIFDDLDTIQLPIPLQIWMIGFRRQLLVVGVLLLACVRLCWTRLRAVSIPRSWPWVVAYAIVLTGVCEAIHQASLVVPGTPVHLAVLLPAATGPIILVVRALVERARVTIDNG